MVGDPALLTDAVMSPMAEVASEVEAKAAEWATPWAKGEGEAMGLQKVLAAGRRTVVSRSATLLVEVMTTGMPKAAACMVVVVVVSPVGQMKRAKCCSPDLAPLLAVRLRRLEAPWTELRHHESPMLTCSPMRTGCLRMRPPQQDTVR